jgi:hypothetical protein
LAAGHSLAVTQGQRKPAGVVSANKHHNRHSNGAVFTSFSIAARHESPTATVCTDGGIVPDGLGRFVWSSHTYSSIYWSSFVREFFDTFFDTFPVLKLESDSVPAQVLRLTYVRVVFILIKGENYRELLQEDTWPLIITKRTCNNSWHLK